LLEFTQTKDFSEGLKGPHCANMCYNITSPSFCLQILFVSFFNKPRVQNKAIKPNEQANELVISTMV